METMENNEELQSSGASEEVTTELENPNSQAGETVTPETQETEEQKNARALEEDAERKRTREERKQASIQRRFDELTAKRYQEEARANELQRQLDEYRKGNQQQSQPDTEPRREQFAEYEDFIEARAVWRAEQIVQQRLEGYGSEQQKRSKMEQAEKTRQESQRAFVERRNAVAKELPDFQEVMEDWSPQLPDLAAEIIINHEKGPLISYHLAKNPELETKIRNAPDYMQGVLIGQLVATLDSKPKQTSAPAPGKPVSSSKGGSASGEPPSDPNQYYEWAKKNLR